MGFIACDRKPKKRYVKPTARRALFQHDTLHTMAMAESTTPSVEECKRTAVEGRLRMVGFDEPHAHGEGNLIASSTDRPGVQLPVLDLDIPHRLVPSSTPGHAHLFLEIEVPDEKYERLLEVLVDCGILGEGNLNQFRASGATYARQPHVKKGDFPSAPPWPPLSTRPLLRARSSDIF